MPLRAALDTDLLTHVGLGVDVQVLKVARRHRARHLGGAKAKRGSGVCGGGGWLGAGARSRTGRGTERKTGLMVL